jgi:hypothetical protein
MKSSLHKKLISEVKKLKRITSELLLEDLVNFVAIEQYKFNVAMQKYRSNKNQMHEEERLSSPLKQCMYLLGIASNQDEPKQHKIIDQDKHDQIVKLLNSLFDNYAISYFPDKKELAKGLDDNWIKSREIAMTAFLHYFTSGFKVSTDQIKSWILYYFDGYEEKIKSVFGVTHRDMISAGEYFEERIKNNWADLNDLFRRADKHRLDFIKRIENGENYDQVVAELRSDIKVKQDFTNCLNRMNEIYSFRVNEARRSLGDPIVNCLLENFVTTRGKSKDLIYITDENDVIRKPLLTSDGDKLFFIVNNSFYQAIIENIEKALSTGKGRNKFLRTRDKRLELQSASQFRRLFPKDSLFYEGVYETNSCHNEHDLIIIHDRYLYIVEAKASPPREPLRDPDKAYQKIRDHFRSKSGIQKAFNQANSLRSKILAKGSQLLYDHNGNVVENLKKDEFDNIYCICLTRDDFGPLATNLSLLLEKDQDTPYPWVISITDLEFLINAWIHIGFDIKKLNLYLTQRINLHGKVFGVDELEYAGAFLKYGGLEYFIRAKADLVSLDPSESAIFDEIYFAEIEGRKYELVTTTPNFITFDKSKLYRANRKSDKVRLRKHRKKNKRRISSASKRINRKHK